MCRGEDGPTSNNKTVNDGEVDCLHSLREKRQSETKTNSISAEPSNLIPVYLAGIPPKCLIDTGSGLRLVSEKVLEKLKQANKYTNENLFDFRTESHNISSADASPMKMMATCDTKIKIAGLKIPYSFQVIKNLGFDVLIGTNFLTDVKGVIDMGSNILSIYDGLVKIPMTKNGCAAAVYTICNV